MMKRVDVTLVANVCRPLDADPVSAHDVGSSALLTGGRLDAVSTKQAFLV
jgi:hypothetical protein